ncbi:MAG: glycosyltransferase [Sporolactobacillus sp.]
MTFIFYYSLPAIILLTTSFCLSLRRPAFFSKLLISCCCMVNVAYIIWRIGFTFPSHGFLNWIAGALLLAAEIEGLLQMFVFYTLVWKPAARCDVPLEKIRELPTVDVMIVTYNEPLSILRRTVAGAKLLHYPSELLNIYVCDDGNRADVREMAQRFGSHYLAREDHLHAKAGNLNHALAHSSGEIIAVFDADMVPLNAFLTRTIGLFSDPKVAFVQTPQAFYNDDPYQYNSFSGNVLPNEQDFFMRTLLSGKARFNAVMFVGSNALFRRSALQAIGGFATGVITEDMATGMIIQSKGYRTLFVEDVLAMGLAPESWGDMLKQRDRWCRGNIQCAKKWNPLTLKGLSLMQRILYMDGLIYWFFGIFKMIYIAAPLLFLLFNIYSLQTGLLGVLAFWLPSFIGSLLSFQIVSKRKRSMIWSHIYDTSMAPRLALSAVMELCFNKQMRFKVTPKGKQSGQRYMQLSTVMPHLIMLALTIVALGRVAADLLLFHRLDWQLMGFNLFWSLYNLIGLIMAVVVAINQPRFRRAERFRINRPLEVRFSRGGAPAPAMLIDANEFGALVQVPLEHLSSEAAPVDIWLSIDDIAPIVGRCVWVSAHNCTVSLGVQFARLETEQYVALIDYLFNANNLRRSDIEQRGSSFIATIRRVVVHAMRPRKAFQRHEIRKPMNAHASIMLLPAARINQAALEAAAALFDIEQFAGNSHRMFSEKQKVKIIDLSAKGCQLQSNFPIPLKNRVIIFSDCLQTKRQKAQVVWSRSMHGRYFTGLRFLQLERPDTAEEKRGQSWLPKGGF